MLILDSRGAGQHGSALIEVLVVIALPLPAVEAARRFQCSNNLEQLALATPGDESTRGITASGQMKLSARPPSGFTLFVSDLRRDLLHRSGRPRLFPGADRGAKTAQPRDRRVAGS